MRLLNGRKCYQLFVRPSTRLLSLVRRRAASVGSNRGLAHCRRRSAPPPVRRVFWKPVLWRASTDFPGALDPRPVDIAYPQPTSEYHQDNSGTRLAAPPPRGSRPPSPRPDAESLRLGSSHLWQSTAAVAIVVSCRPILDSGSHWQERGERKSFEFLRLKTRLLLSIFAHA